MRHYKLYFEPVNRLDLSYVLWVTREKTGLKIMLRPVVPKNVPSTSDFNLFIPYADCKHLKYKILDWINGTITDSLGLVARHNIQKFSKYIESKLRESGV
jgi:hypothetical protein